MPLQAWREGIRKFEFERGFGEYTVTPKVERALTEAVMACHSYYCKLNELRRLYEEVCGLRETLGDMSSNYDLPPQPLSDRPWFQENETPLLR